MQAKLTATADATNSKAVLNDSAVRSVGVDETLSVSETNDVINFAVNEEKTQEKLTIIADNDGAKALLVGTTLKGLAANASVSVIELLPGTLQIYVNKDVTQEVLDTTSDTTTSKAVLASKPIRSVGVDDTMNIGLTGNVINLRFKIS